MRAVLAVCILACVLARARLAHQVPGRPLTGRVMSTMKDFSHASGSENLENSSSFGEEQFWKLPELLEVHKMENIELVSYNVLFYLHFLQICYISMCVLIYVLNLEKEFLGSGETL